MIYISINYHYTALQICCFKYASNQTKVEKGQFQLKPVRSDFNIYTNIQYSYIKQMHNEGPIKLQHEYILD